MINPTKETYDGFLKYYDLFNDIFFDNQLPNCLITYQRGRNYMAYYCYQRFEKDNAYTDEIAINPQAFKGKSKEIILSTFLHEMVHLKQQYFGFPSRNGYHNKQWAMMMKEVGLQPFGVGKGNYGKETGQKMNHRVIPGGVFEKFLESDPYDFSIWVDAIEQYQDLPDNGGKENLHDKIEGLGLKAPNENEEIEEAAKKFLDTHKEYLEALFNGVEEEAHELAKDNGYKIKYSCRCGVNIWAKSGVKMLCLECNTAFTYAS